MDTPRAQPPQPIPAPKMKDKGVEESIEGEEHSLSFQPIGTVHLASRMFFASQLTLAAPATSRHRNRFFWGSRLTCPLRLPRIRTYKSISTRTGACCKRDVGWKDVHLLRTRWVAHNAFARDSRHCESVGACGLGAEATYADVVPLPPDASVEPIGAVLPPVHFLHAPTSSSGGGESAPPVITPAVIPTAYST